MERGSYNTQKQISHHARVTWFNIDPIILLIEISAISVFTLLNYTQIKPHLGPKFCITYIPEDNQVAINQKASQYLKKIWEFWGILGNIGELLPCFSNFPKIKLPKIPQNSPKFPLTPPLYTIVCTIADLIFI